ncbi:MAG: hypothetical protein ACK5MD_10990 [Flavobacteriales bacterium]
MQRKTLYIIIIMVSNFLFSQEVGIGTEAPQSILDISSTTSGILIPRITTAQREVIKPSATEDGLLVYDTDLKNFMIFKKKINKWAHVNTDSAGLLNLTPLSSTKEYVLTETYVSLGEIEIVPLAKQGEMLAQCNIQNNLSGSTAETMSCI